jgi:hypothetical protein
MVLAQPAEADVCRRRRERVPEHGDPEVMELADLHQVDVETSARSRAHQRLLDAARRGPIEDPVDADLGLFGGVVGALHGLSWAAAEVEAPAA